MSRVFKLACGCQVNERDQLVSMCAGCKKSHDELHRMAAAGADERRANLNAEVQS